MATALQKNLKHSHRELGLGTPEKKPEPVAFMKDMYPPPFHPFIDHLWYLNNVTSNYVNLPRAKRLIKIGEVFGGRQVFKIALHLLGYLCKRSEYSQEFPAMGNGNAKLEHTIFGIQCCSRMDNIVKLDI